MPIGNKKSKAKEDYFHPKTLQMYYGKVSDLEKGWQLADGTNKTPDMRGYFPRGASSDSEVGATVGFSTAMPGSGFNVSSDSHYHTTNPAKATTSSDTHSHTIYGDSAESIDGGGTSSGDAVLKNRDGKYNHNFTTSSDAHTHTIDIPSTRSSTDTHSHSITGGDTETAPDHVLVYWIAYTGKLAPNWSK